MGITDNFIILTVDEERADQIEEDQPIWLIERALDTVSAMVRDQDFSGFTSLTSAHAVDQYGSQYANVKVKPNVVIEYDGDVYAGSDGFLINMSNTLDYVTRRFNKLKAEQ